MAIEIYNDVFWGQDDVPTFCVGVRARVTLGNVYVF